MFTRNALRCAPICRRLTEPRVWCSAKIAKLSERRHRSERASVAAAQSVRDVGRVRRAVLGPFSGDLALELPVQRRGLVGYAVQRVQRVGGASGVAIRAADRLGAAGEMGGSHARLLETFVAGHNPEPLPGR